MGGFPVPHVWNSPSFPCVGWGSGKSVGRSGHEPALRGFAAHSVAAVAVGSKRFHRSCWRHSLTCWCSQMLLMCLPQP